MLTAGSKSYSYDAAGRTTQVVAPSGTTNLTYDFESRIASINGPGITASYTYNGLDTRVGKTENSVSQTFVRDGVGVTAPVIRDSLASYTPGISERRGSDTTFLHSGLKNAEAQTQGTGTVTAEKTFDAFGNLTSSTGTWKGPFGYAGGFGYQEDASGLKLLGHRYYDSSTGRFLTRDPAKDGRNWYVYCGGNPVNFYDAVGLNGDYNKGIVFGLLNTPGYVDGHGQFVVGEVKTGTRGGPWVPERVIHFDYPHGRPGYRSSVPHLNSDVFPNIDHAAVPPRIMPIGSEKFIKGLAKFAMVVALIDDGITIAKSPAPIEAGLKAATVWGAAWVGAEIGTAICPGVGTLLGGLIFAVATSVIVHSNE